MRKAVYPMEMLGRCRHEAGHAAIFWYLGDSFHEANSITINTTEYKREIDYFKVRLLFSPQEAAAMYKTIDHPVRKMAETEEETPTMPNVSLAEDHQVREMLKLQVENAILILLGGPLAEFYFHGLPHKAIRRGLKNPVSDAALIREYLIALRGKDDRAYQVRLQAKAWDIIMEARTWSAINKTADILLEKRYLSGLEIQEIFEKSGAPQDWTNCL